MKRIIMLSLGLFLIFACFAQQKTRTYDEYMQRSKKRGVAAWVFLGTGTALTVGGTVLFANGVREDDDDYDYDDDDAHVGKIIGGAVMMVTGITLMGTSIPFFIMSHRYKRKAMNVAFKTEKIQLPRMGKSGNQYYPALSMKINIGR